MQLVEEMKAEGIAIGQVALERLLYLYSQHGRVEDCEKTMEALAEYGDVKEGLLSQMIKVYEEAGEKEKTEALLASMKEREQGLHLRGYNNLLPGLITKQGGLAKVWDKLVEMDQLQMSPNALSLTSVLKACNQNDNKTNTANGFAVLDEMRARGLPLDSESLMTVGNWFKTVQPMGKQWSVRKTLVGRSGTCFNCNKLLEPVKLTTEERMALCRELHSWMFPKKGNQSPKMPSRAVRRFQRYLNEWGPFDPIVDGMNVGFGTAPQSIFNSNAIVRLVDKLVDEGKRPLVILKEHIRDVPTQMMIKWGWEGLEKLETAGQLYYVSESPYDDIYVMLAALQSDMRVSVVSNDCMRDHRSRLPREIYNIFCKWQRGHQVQFSYDYRSGAIGLQDRLVHDYVVQYSPDRTMWHFPPVPEPISLKTRVNTTHDVWLCMKACEGQ